MLGEGPVTSMEYCVTNEETSPGNFPRWLRRQIRTQALNPGRSEAAPGRILVIYPNENSRREAISELGLSGAVDTTLHHTIASLAASLLADFRLPRPIQNDGPFEEILHSECSKESASLGFPLINPLPEMNWGKGKTRALASLHTQLSSELALEGWDGPGIHTFRKIILRLERKLGGTHPDMVVPRIIDELKSGKEPFSISDIDGIVLLDHAPGLCKSHTEMLLQISRHRPIHQLTYPGNFRLGYHGHLLLDRHPITDPEDLPDWIVRTEREVGRDSPVARRILLRREDHSFDATIRLTKEKLLANPNARVMIVDPSLEENGNKWERLLTDIGIIVHRSRRMLSSDPVAHWIIFLANVPYGPDSFSLESLRALSLQEAIPLFDTPPEHPSDSSIYPKPNSQLLTNLAREEHVLGGPGALFRWLSTLSRPSSEEQNGPEKECAQWWFLCVVNSLRPLLRPEDRKALDGGHFSIGCASGKRLPLPESSQNGDEWLLRTLSSIDIESTMDIIDGASSSPASVIQEIWRNHSKLREMQSIAGQKAPDNGHEWVEEITSLCRKSTIRGSGTGAIGRVRLTSPRDALGCNSDLTILSNLSSSSWNLRVTKVPFIGDEERNSMDILRPDGPIRDARHHLNHLLNSAPEVIVLDPALDETRPPSAPIREWASSFDPDDSKAEINPTEGQLSSPRDFRQFDGIQIRKDKPPSRPPINPSAVSVGLDPEMQSDRQRRQPFRADEDGYLPKSALPYILSLETASLNAKTPDGVEEPRNNPRWPVVGGIGVGGKRTVSIDPRPFSPLPTGSMVSDSRHGHSVGAEQDVRIWSPTRLQKWLECPRSGWLSRELMAGNEELIDEEIDRRTHGNLLHLVHHDVLSRVLKIPMGGERELSAVAENPSIARSGIGEGELMQIALESLDSRAPWLERSDAVATHSLHSLTGMNLKQWGEWLAEPVPKPAIGRIGTIVSSETSCADSSPISLEWSTDNFIDGGVEISLPPELTEGVEIAPINIRGFIDRVDLLPFDNLANKWLDEEGQSTVAPIRLHESGWKPRRLVAIRDLKTTDAGSAQIRHVKGLLEELQLALYARAWEISHPGDLVLAAGISLFGHHSEHRLEVSSKYSENLPELRLGTRTSITSRLHRFSDEDPFPPSDHFRAWMTHRISVALRVAQQASRGRVHPTPSPGVCRYCSVSDTCNVMEEGGY